MTCSFNDEKLSAVVDELGMEGYGFWWRILEVVAEKMDENRIFDVEFSENQVMVSIPNLLKYRDEWSRKKARNSGVAPEELRPSRAFKKDQDIDKEDITPPVSPP